MAERFTVGEVEDQAREILLDTFDNAYRFEPKEIYRALVSGIDAIWLARPSSRYVAGLLVTEPEEINGGLYVATGGMFQTVTSAGQVTQATNSVPGGYDEVSVLDFRGMVVNMERRWLPAMVYYVVHRMYLKDDPDTGNASLADRYLAMYKEALG